MPWEVPHTSIGLVSWKATCSEFQRGRFFKDVLLEGIATFWWLFGISMAQMDFEGRAANPYTKAILGLYVMAILEAWMHVNPTAVNVISTLVFVVTKKLSVIKGLFYMIAQFGCGIGATQLVFAVTPKNISSKVTAPGPSLGVTTSSCWIMEWICVTIFMMVILSATDRRKKRPMLPHLAIGFALVSLSLYAGPYGVSLNPISALSIAVAVNDFSYTWIYFTAGPVGGLTAVLAYNFLILDHGYHCAIADYQNPLRSLTRATTIVNPIGVDNYAFELDKHVSNDQQYILNISGTLENGIFSNKPNNIPVISSNPSFIQGIPDKDSAPSFGYLNTSEEEASHYTHIDLDTTIITAL